MLAVCRIIQDLDLQFLPGIIQLNDMSEQIYDNLSLVIDGQLQTDNRQLP